MERTPGICLYGKKKRCAPTINKLHEIPQDTLVGFANKRVPVDIDTLQLLIVLGKHARFRTDHSHVKTSTVQTGCLPPYSSVQWHWQVLDNDQYAFSSICQLLLLVALKSVRLHRRDAQSAHPYPLGIPRHRGTCVHATALRTRSAPPRLGLTDTRDEE